MVQQMKQWIFLAVIFFSLVSTDDNCYKKNLCYGRESGSVCANSTTLVQCRLWQDNYFPCPYGCMEKTAGAAQCGCLNNCSGIGTCSSGKCVCPNGYSGLDCSTQSVCLGKKDGYYCFNSTYAWCYNEAIQNQYACSFGCSSSGCNCPNNCSGFTCVNNVGQCQCPSNRTGNDCGVINPCTSSSSGSICINATASGYCSGTYLYAVTNCPNGCNAMNGYCACAPSCKNHGSCNGGICTCDSGYLGANCDQVSPCYTSRDYGYSCRGNQRLYCSSYDHSVTVTNCSTTCVSEYSYAQCTCGCDSTYDRFSVCMADGSCSCTAQWQGPHCWTLPVGRRRFCDVPDGTYCNGTDLITCSGTYPRGSSLCSYGCKRVGLGGQDRCACPIGPNGLECSGAGSCTYGQCYCRSSLTRQLDCSPDPCRSAGVNSGTVCTNDYTAAQCVGGQAVTEMFCSAGCVPQGGQAKCNMYCGPNGESSSGSCKCAKGYSACPAGFYGDTCDRPISACTFTNSTTAVTTCEGDQQLTCVNSIAVSSTTCAEGCLRGKCKCSREKNCSGHGTCLDGTCACDVGWTGVNCQEQELSVCVGRSNGRYCGNNNVTGEVYWCFKEKHVGSQWCPGPCSEETTKCSCPFDCHGHGDCSEGVCFCKGLWFGPACKYSGFTLALQIVGAVALLAGLLLGSFMLTSYKHTRNVPLYRLDQARKTDYDFSEEEVVLMDSHVEGYQSMGRSVFKRLFKKQ